MNATDKIDVIELHKAHGILLFGVLYQAVNAACLPLDFRFINFYGYTFSGTALIYPMLYVFLDAITRIGGRYTAIKLAIIFELANGLFTLLISGINLLPSASLNSNSISSFTTISNSMTLLYFSSMFGNFFAGIIGVLFFATIQKRIKSFFWASNLSTVIIILGHNIPTGYMTFHKLYPTVYWQIIITNYLVNCLVVIVTSAILNFVLVNKQPFKIYTHKNDISEI